MRVLVFTRNGSRVPELPGIETQHIRFESSKLDDLLVVAKYRIVNFPTSLLIDDRGKVLLKVKGNIPKYYLNSLDLDN